MTLIALNWAPEERLGTVSAPRFDPALAGGGLSSREIGLDLLVDSVQATQPVGHQILTDGVDEDVITEFQEVTPTGSWSSEFRLDGGDMRLRFHGEREFLLNYSTTTQRAADEIFSIARRYGFFSSEVGAALKSLNDRTFSLLDEWDARPLTVGVAESDLASEATALASEWDEFIRSYGEDPLGARVDEAKRQVLLVVAEVAGRPTNAGIDEYNAAVRRMNQAATAYRQAR